MGQEATRPLTPRHGNNVGEQPAEETLAADARYLRSSSRSGLQRRPRGGSRQRLIAETLVRAMFVEKPDVCSALVGLKGSKWQVPSFCHARWTGVQGIQPCVISNCSKRVHSMMNMSHMRI
jgi:hypothetical protein